MLRTEKEIIRYFEFKKHEYYMLIAVNNEKPFATDNKAIRLYAEHIGSTKTDVRLEGHPVEITKEDAMLKYFLAKGNECYPVGTLKDQFERGNDTPLLIDHSLL